MKLVKAVAALKLSSHEHFLVPTLTFSLRTSRLTVITEIDRSEACMHAWQLLVGIRERSLGEGGQISGV